MPSSCLSLQVLRVDIKFPVGSFQLRGADVSLVIRALLLSSALHSERLWLRQEILLSKGKSCGCGMSCAQAVFVPLQVQEELFTLIFFFSPLLSLLHRATQLTSSAPSQSGR